MPSSLATPGHAAPADPRAIDSTRFRWLLWALCKVSAELERMFPGRSFMPEGRVADAVAQGIAEAFYDVGVLLDGYADDPPALTVKAAQGGRVWLDDCPEHLLVLRLFRDGSFDEVYNGPGDLAWALTEAVVRRSKGPWAVKLPALRKAMQDVPDEQRRARIGAS
jgi:hypothetical protein